MIRNMHLTDLQDMWRGLTLIKYLRGKLRIRSLIFMYTGMENSIIVYSGDTERVSALVCNWYGAGNAGLYAEDADSSIQSYDNLYDENWIENGSEMLQPGVERLDTVKTEDGYKMESVWVRDDICDTSMFKLSTEMGCLYGYTEIDGMWQFLALDWETGETILSVPVSTLAGYNNMAVGMMQGTNGNALYVPTNNMELLCLRDRFAYLPEKEFVQLDIRKLCRENWDGGEDVTEVTFLHTLEADQINEPTVAAVRVNGLSGKAGDLRLFARTSEEDVIPFEGEWELTEEGGAVVDDETQLQENKIYEVRLTMEDQSEYDQNDQQSSVKISVALGR